MADTPETPAAGADDKTAPTPRRRAAPRKTTAKDASASPKAAPARRAPSKRQGSDAGIVAEASDAIKTIEGGATKAARSTKAAVTRTAKKAEDAAATTTRKAATALGVVKPRSTKRSTNHTPPKRGTAAKSAPRAAPAKGPARSGLSRTADKVGGKWGAAAMVGGLAAAGAAAAALLSIRSSTPKADAPASPTGTKRSGKHGATNSTGTPPDKSND
ncbi:histone H1-like protein [Sphingomonas gellani]|uniref:Histone H1-like protein n=1 Tax=Sphingomonas gellani TaxID=1166340 RepID=A0A1H7YG61_9SPHN|nr:hypothetical protein [Sphingomonas gellani]SEM45100.1 histone H1-like protein [Sphingomonas gellani]